VITEGKRHDVRVARTLGFAPGTILVVDRGYTDYRWFGELTAQGVWFVTRLKDAAVYAVIEDRRIPAQGRVERDQVIRLTGVGAAEKCPHALRRIEVYDPEKDETLVFLTNHLAFGATTIAAIYRDRWQIELFFKALKQNLKIKTFVGTSANALKVQVWTALIAMLLLKYLQLKARFAWSLSNLVALLRMNLLDASRSLGLARSAVRGPSGRPRDRAGGAGPCLIGTAVAGNLISARGHARPEAQEITRCPGRFPVNLDSSELGHSCDGEPVPAIRS
jgi:Transposase DDE domain